MWASVVAARGFRSWGAWAWLLPGMWNLPRPGIEPMSPALAGEFLSTGPPKKTSICFLYLASSDGGQLLIRLSQVLLNLPVNDILKEADQSWPQPRGLRLCTPLPIPD